MSKKTFFKQASLAIAAIALSSSVFAAENVAKEAKTNCAAAKEAKTNCAAAKEGKTNCAAKKDEKAKK